MKHPLLPLPERTEQKDKVYAALGRALAYANEFENNCRILAHLLDVDHTDEDYMFEIWKLMDSGTLFQKIERAVKVHGLENWSANEIHEARKARNWIAHELGLVHKQMENSEESIRNFQAHILGAVTRIIPGNQIVLDSIRLIDEPKTVCGSDVVAYHAAVCDWILP